MGFAQYKQPTIKRRLHRRMVLHKIGSFEEYVRYLEQNPAEIGALHQDILIHVTRFFRDSESFEALTSGAFGSVAGNRAGDAPIRVWIPGCSTGEEAYSVAIALIEFLGERADDTPGQLFATDVSDVGRPIGDIKPNIDCPELDQLIAEAIDSLTTKEREVQDHSGRRYCLRIRPYKSVESCIDGAVIALFERQDGRAQEVRMKDDSSCGLHPYFWPCSCSHRQVIVERNPATVMCAFTTTLPSAI